MSGRASGFVAPPCRREPAASSLRAGHPAQTRHQPRPTEVSRMISRRHFLAGAGLLPLVRLARAAPQRVVIVGGGWGGLSAARHLRAKAPELEVVLIDRQPAFHSFALSNRWLVGHGNAAIESHDYAALARRFGYQFRQAGVDAIDREQRVVFVGGERLAYDWLVLAPGIRENWAAWQVDDAAVGELRRRHSGA